MRDPADVVTAVVGALAAAVLISTSVPAPAQELPPGKPIRVILAVGVGGTSDVFMRLLGEEYHRRYGHPFVIENHPNGSGNVGGRTCAEAANCPMRRSPTISSSIRNCPLIRIHWCRSPIPSSTPS
jgi:tripartite-type tricarboxylate transporter receptor subunit TctC